MRSRGAGPGVAPALVAFGVAAVEVGRRVRYITAAEFVETLYRGLADNSVGRVMEIILRAALVIIDEVGFALLDDSGAQLPFRFVAGADERRALGIGSHWSFGQWGTVHARAPPPSVSWTLIHHAVVVAAEGESFRMRQARSKGGGPRTAKTKQHQ